ncbi:MAG: M43 family zinc metalloprotease [Bacteroidota bacterium]
MSKQSLTLLLSLLFLLSSDLSAQRNCGSMEYLEIQKQQDPKRQAKMESIENFTRQYLNNSQNRIEGIVTIPVVVHIVYNNSAENLSNAQIQSQMDVLNEDFRRLNPDADNTWPQAADSEIEFCLATVDPTGAATDGITRTFTNVSSFGTNDNVKFDATGGKNAWPAADYLNFWVCDLSGGLLGYAQFPGGPPATDGIVNDYAYTGRGGSAQAPFDLGRTATHEVGHWLNLRHIWGDGGCGVDDFVADTPLSDASNGGCNVGHVSCGSVDMVQNYMDYSHDDCMNLYTFGQKARMRALFDPGGFRASLLNSNGCGSGNPPTCTDGVQNGNETGVDCGGPDCPACPTCTDGVQNGNETGVDCGGPDCPSCPCNANEITITINLDNYPEETTWSLLNSADVTIASGGPYGNLADGSTVIEFACIDNGCYDFIINDSYGDGICCSYGTGSYEVTDASGGVLASGGQFGFSESTVFCVSGPLPTCTDGIQNGQETGVDCGGPDCPACPTCTDGIQNGQETGVDCGGPDCPACPTCTDGIQNGQETGVDCGGPDCPPCQGPACSYVGIDFNDFEGGWGIWNDGGSDCRRSRRDVAFANSGEFCVRLRDNSGSSVMTTDALNLTAYEELTVDFSYIVSNFDDGNEDFWLLISIDGGPFVLVEEWNLGDEFQNDVRESGNVVIAGPFGSSTRLQFRCDASTNNDRVYIDDVDITGCTIATREEQPTQTGPVLGTQARQPAGPVASALSQVQLFPNPASSTLNVRYTLAEAGRIELIITDFTGKTLRQQLVDGAAGEQLTALDVSGWNAGFYFVSLRYNGQVTTQKIVVTH